jgi:hypothetical protein
LILPSCTAANAASSESKTRAGPVCLTRSVPATFTTQPSGASEPWRIMMPPRGFSGLDSGRSTSWPASLLGVARFLKYRSAGNRGRVLQYAGFHQPLGHQALAARTLHVHGDESAGRLQVRQGGRFRRDAIEIFQGERNADLARNGEQVQDAVGRAAGGGDRGDRVFERGRG